MNINILISTTTTKNTKFYTLHNIYRTFNTHIQNFNINNHPIITENHIYERFIITLYENTKNFPNNQTNYDRSITEQFSIILIKVCTTKYFAHKTYSSQHRQQKRRHEKKFLSKTRPNKKFILSFKNSLINIKTWNQNRCYDYNFGYKNTSTKQIKRFGA